jgi:hypothetical protein
MFCRNYLLESWFLYVVSIKINMYISIETALRGCFVKKKWWWGIGLEIKGVLVPAVGLPHLDRPGWH